MYWERLVTRRDEVRDEALRVVRFARRHMLALEAVLTIAHHARGRPVRAWWLADRHGVPPRYLEQPLQQLVRRGVLKGVRGPHGGYVLARERRRITIGEILRALVAGEKDPRTAHTDLGRAILTPLWIEISHQGLGRFDQITLEDLCRRAQKAGIPADIDQVQDFTI